MSDSELVAKEDEVPLRKATGKKRNTTGHWKLKYKDFLPRIKAWDKKESGDTFKDLIDRANNWLKKNSDVLLKTCEAVTWHARDVTLLGSGEEMTVSKSMETESETFYLRGLRLWLTPRKVRRKQLEVLAYFDCIPDEVHKDFVVLVQAANDRIESTKLKGKIVSVESTTACSQNDGIIAHSLTSWTELAGNNVHFLRVYYLTGDSSLGSIGLEDFVPLPCEDGGYEEFGQMVDRASDWLRKTKEITIRNLQSVIVPKEGPHDQIGKGCFYRCPSLEDENPTEFFRILRIGYTRSEASSAAQRNSTQSMAITPITYISFTPDIVPERKDAKAPRKVQDMKETFDKLSSFLRTTDCDIISVETVINPCVFEEEQTEAGQNEPACIQGMMSLRLFMNEKHVTSAERLNVTDGDAAKKQLQVTQDSDHPGPIFLANVVNRRYKYRWLVAGITVFVAMSIIVVVSIVSSHQM